MVRSDEWRFLRALIGSPDMDIGKKSEALRKGHQSRRNEHCGVFWVIAWQEKLCCAADVCRQNASIVWLHVQSIATIYHGNFISKMPAHRQHIMSQDKIPDEVLSACFCGPSFNVILDIMLLHFVGICLSHDSGVELRLPPDPSGFHQYDCIILQHCMWFQGVGTRIIPTFGNSRLVVAWYS